MSTNTLGSELMKDKCNGLALGGGGDSGEDKRLQSEPKLEPDVLQPRFETDEIDTSEVDDDDRGCETGGG